MFGMGNLRSANGPVFSRAARDAMMTQLGMQESSGSRRLQPKVRRVVLIW